MTETNYRWLQLNQQVFQNVRLSKEDLTTLISIYNDITGESQKMTGCGRCVANIKKRVKAAYDSYESL